MDSWRPTHSEQDRQNKFKLTHHRLEGNVPILAGMSFRGQAQGCWMLGLIEADLASAGKRYLRNGTPSCFLNCGALNVLLCEGGYFGFQVVAYEIEFVGIAMLIGRVECGFGRRQGEDEPAMARIDRLEPEDVAEEGAVCLGVFAVEDYVSARDHRIPPKKIAWELLAGCRSQSLDDSIRIKRYVSGYAVSSWT